MKYENIVPGRFLSRPNRFIAYAELEGRTEKVHVKNTGRCRELLTERAEIYLEKSRNPERSTGYDLVAVRKGDRMINMDSQAPNKAVAEWLEEKVLFPDLQLLQPEKTCKNSRFDFYLETKEQKIFIEVKGVTLERDNAVFFPDAPSDRAVRHVEELTELVKEGYGACILFVIQMEDVEYFAPNEETHPAFAQALRHAAAAGVEILAYDCHVTPDSMTIRRPVPVILSVMDQIADPLLAWYDRGRRVLPWREDPKPYYVWLSEIMLQQTRVEAVKPYFDRFIREVPDIATLAGLEEDRLVKLWEGLGYYNRVRNLQKAAVMVMEAYGGELPADPEKLLELPGIGTYTAGAVASIAYGRKVPAVDGNVLRVLARLRMDGEDILSQKTKTRVEQELAKVIPEERAGDFNQALMELGAMVCLPNGQPKCTECPWELLCMAHREGCELEFPKKKTKKARTREEKTVLVILDEERAAFCRRPDTGLLAGMYEFPVMEGYRTEEEVLCFLKEKGWKVLRILPLKDSKHIFTHKEWHMKGYMVRVDELEKSVEEDGESPWIFISREEAAEQYPIPAAYAAYTDCLRISLGIDRVRQEIKEKENSREAE